MTVTKQPAISRRIRWWGWLAALLPWLIAPALTNAALIPQNLAPGATIQSNDGGISGSVFDLNDQESDGGRFHQSIDADTTNIKVAFVRADVDPVSFVRFWNLTDTVSGTFDFKLQSLNIGGNPAVDGDWSDITGTATSYANMPRSDYLSFAPVSTRAIRWVWTKDNSPTGAGNVRYSEFEYYTDNVNALDRTATLASAQYTDGVNTINLLGGPVFDNQYGTRFESPQVKPQVITMLWNDDGPVDQIRLASADMTGNHTEAFTLDYLVLGGNPANPGDWLPTGISYTGGTAPWLLIMNTAHLQTRGLRLNIADPSTAGHEILRLWEIEVFGIPEPSTALLFALGGGLVWRFRPGRRGAGGQPLPL